VPLTIIDSRFESKHTFLFKFTLIITYISLIQTVFVQSFYTIFLWCFLVRWNTHLGFLSLIDPNIQNKSQCDLFLARYRRKTKKSVWVSEGVRKIERNRNCERERREREITFHHPTNDFCFSLFNLKKKKKKTVAEEEGNKKLSLPIRGFCFGHLQLTSTSTSTTTILI